MEDPGRTLTLEQVRQAKFDYTPTTHPPKFGFTRSAVWMKCELAVPAGRYVLTIDHIYLSNVDLYVTDQAGTRHETFGLNHALDESETPYYGYAMGVTLHAPTTVYFRAVSNWPIAWPVQLVDRDSFLSEQRKLDWMFGFYIGVIGILIAYNFFIFLSVRDTSYLYYIGTLFCLHLFSNLAQYGLVRAFLFPQWQFFQSHVFYFTHLSATTTVYLFASHFLQLKKLTPRARYLLIVPACTNVAIFAAGMFLDTYAIDLAFQVSSSLFSYSLMGIAGYLSLRGVKQGRYFFVAWSCLIGFWMVTFLRIDGIVPLNFFTNYSILLGACLEGLLLSLALADRLNEMRAAKEAAEKEALAYSEKGRVMQQVAHDIRAPLAALEVAVREPQEMDEGGRLLVRRAVSRIRDITNDLKSQAPQGSSRMSASLPILVDLIVSEKRMQYTSLSQVEIDWHIEQKDRGMFVQVDRAVFKRLVSNLIDNAVEAMKDRRGVIRVRLERGERHMVTIEDEGPGIPAQILEKLGNQPVTFGKENAGSGLGVFHAAKTLKIWGGALRIENTQRGARVSVLLPPSQTPVWFLPEIALQPKTLLVVVDDDVLLKRTWSQRLDGVDAEVLYFSSPEEVLKWVDAGNPGDRKTIFLLDYEFRNSKLNGLLLADRLEGKGELILATNSFDDDAIQEGCRVRGVKLLAKSLLGLIPVYVVPPAFPKTGAMVLIDDDGLVRMAWEIAARGKALPLEVFDSFEAFCSKKDAIAPGTPIYMDASLPGAPSVEERVSRLHDFGFQEVYIQTGMPASAFSHIPGCRGVQGKDFPVG